MLLAGHQSYPMIIVTNSTAFPMIFNFCYMKDFGGAADNRVKTNCLAQSRPVAYPLLFWMHTLGICTASKTNMLIAH
jgi:hypothetical protein